MPKHGRHWPAEETNVNAFDGFGDLMPADLSLAVAVTAAWAPTRPPFNTAPDVYRPEYTTGFQLRREPH